MEAPRAVARQAASQPGGEPGATRETRPPCGSARPGFVMPPSKARKQAVKPKARDFDCATVAAPPEQVLRKLRDVELVAGIDIETHDEVPENRHGLSKGRFGFFHLCDPSAFNLKIIQIGWHNLP